MMSASEYTGEPSTWYDQGLASDMTATVNGAASASMGFAPGERCAVLVMMNPARSGQSGWEGS